MKNSFLLLLLALLLMISTVGCNALRGAGTDIKDTGKHIENVGR